MKMRFLIICLLIGLAYADLSDNLVKGWNQYKQKFNKVYPDDDTEKARFDIFVKNFFDIFEHNVKYFKNETSYYKAVNQFSDMTYDEVRRVAFGFREGKAFNKSGVARVHTPKLKALPASVDWRTKNVVTPVKDQGSCGSCWAFSTTGVLEGQHALATGKLVSLSEQNLVDCTQQQGNFGCEGGWPFDSYEYIIRFSSGLDTESSYPYKGVDESCVYSTSSVGATATAFAVLTPNSEVGLQEAVANVGPISVCIDANENFMSYAGGVYDDVECKSDFDDIDHCVLAVGYGKDSATGKDYWIVKNSWNTSWGDKGYIKMMRNKRNQCAISTLASYPTVQSTY